MGKITATVLGIDEGFQKFDQVDMIRIKSEKYTLLIMDDYMPVIGRIDGMVEIVSGEDTPFLPAGPRLYITPEKYV